jgi:predicted nucleic acid-binding protein
MKPEVFLDTAYALALSSPGDVFHQQAVHLAEKIGAASVRLVTTRAIMLEIGNAFSKRRRRPAGVELRDALEADPRVEIIPLSEQLYGRAWQLFRERPDKQWGLTDCVSFIVMQDRGLTEALTSDEHFQQAGFHTLMQQ